MQIVVKYIVGVWVALLLPWGLVAQESQNLFDYVPRAKNIQLLSHFQIQSIQETNTAVVIEGRAQGVMLTITKDKAKPDAFSIAGKNVRLEQFIDEAKNIPFLRNIAFEKLIHDKDTNAILGRLNNQDVHILTKTGHDKAFEITSKALKLEDFIADARNIPLVRDVVFEKLIHENGKDTIDGTYKNIHVEIVTRTKENKAFELTTSPLGLDLFMKEAAQIPVLKQAKFTKLIVKEKDKAVSIEGVFGKATLNIETTLETPEQFKLTSNGITLGDIDPYIAKEVPVLGPLKLDLLEYDGVWLEADFVFNALEMKFARELKTPSAPLLLFTPSLKASTFIPTASNSPLENMALIDTVFVLNTTSNATQFNTYPNELAPALKEILGGDTATIESGLNIFATIDVKSSGALKEILTNFGSTELKLPLSGVISKETFAFLHGKSDKSTATPAQKKSLVKEMKLSVKLPKFSLPKGSGASSDSDAKMGIGTNEAAKRFSARGASKVPDEEHATLFFTFGTKMAVPELQEPFSATIAIDDAQAKTFTLLVTLDKPWKEPFGVKDVLIHEGGFVLTLMQDTQDVDFFGKADVHTHRNVELEADIIKASDGLALNYFDIKGKFPLDSFTGGNLIPHAKEFELDEIKLTMDGIEAKTQLFSNKIDAYLFQTPDGGWVFALNQKNMHLKTILPAVAKEKLLVDFSLPNVALLLSNKGISGTTEDFSLIGKEMFKAIFGDTKLPLRVSPGVALVAEFDPKSMGRVGDGLKKIGVHEDAIMMGEILGVFGGDPGFEFRFMMKSHDDPALLPKKAMNFSKKMDPSFFLRWTKEVVDVGVAVGMDVKAGKDSLYFETMLELEFTEKGIGIDVMGAMDGAWHHPFGIKMLELSDVKLKVGVNDVGEVKIGFAGKDTIGKEVIDIATEMHILLEDALPDGVAFSGKMSSLSVPALVGIAEELMGQPGQLSHVSFPFFEINDAMFAFATPGATDPQLGLVDEGFAFNGEFFFMSQRLGKVKGSGGPKGITFKGDIQDFDLDIVKFRKNYADVAINEKPKMLIKSHVELIGVTEDVNVDFAPPHFEFDIEEQIGPFGFAALRVRMEGVDLATGKLDKNGDISVIGEFKSTLVPWMRNEITKGLQELTDSAVAQFEKDKKVLDDAMRKVESIDKQIETLKARDDKAKDRANASFGKAKSRVNSLKSSHDHAEHMAKHCGNRWTHWACKGWWKTEAAAIWVSYKVALGVLEAAQKAVAAAFDLNPEILALKAEKDIAMGTLITAKAVVSASEEAEKFVLKELNTLVNTTLKNLPFEIEQAIIVGDLKDMVVHNDPLVLDLKFKLLGKENREYFAIKLKDPAFDATAFALLPVMALDQAVESVIDKISPKAAQWVHAHMAQNLANAEAKVREAVEREEEKFKDILLSFENGSRKFKKAYEEQDEDEAEIIAAAALSDFMNDSKTFSNTYLAIAHSKLCLGVADNGVDVRQEDCKNIATERWSTASLEEGYVQLKSKGLCLKARNKDASQGQPLVLSQCDKDDEHEQWKIISQDGFYDKIINRFSQKCLHFDSENANPHTAFAVWTSCIGADSQMFREISDTERPTWHDVKMELEAKNNSCIATTAKFDSYFDLKGRYGHLSISKESHDKMKRADDDVLQTTPCMAGDTEQFSYIESLEGNIKLVHTESGWCVVPKHDAQHSIILTPCDDGDDMWWHNKREGNAFALFNMDKRLCMELGVVDTQTQKGRAQMAICNTRLLEQEIDFIKK